MSTVAIDTAAARNTERATAFLSEIATRVPVDNFFQDEPTLDHLIRNARLMDVGRQYFIPIGVDDNDSVQFSEDYDLIDTSAQNAARGVVYPIKKVAGALTISNDEVDEYSGNDHKLIDRIEFGRNTILKTAAQKVSTALFAATPASRDIESIAVMIDSTGTTGNLSASTETEWAAEENASTGDLLDDMETLYNELQEQATQPSAIVSTRTVYQSYISTIDVDARYQMTTDTNVLNRRVQNVEFKGKPFWFDGRCTASTLYMWNDDHMYLVIHPSKNRVFGEFMEAYNQDAISAKFIWKLLLACNRRKACGKITGIS